MYIRQNVSYSVLAASQSELSAGRGGALVDLMPFVRRVAGSNPALAAP